MGMEYRDRVGRQRRHRRRTKREEDRWASLAGPVETRRLDEDEGAIAGEADATAQRQGNVGEDQD